MGKTDRQTEKKRDSIRKRYILRERERERERESHHTDTESE